MDERFKDTYLEIIIFPAPLSWQLELNQAGANHDSIIHRVRATSRIVYIFSTVSQCAGVKES